ncbi:thiamine diphosphate-binding protein [Mycotypha africana]|uniref:thiamine diphosphate-binding protein n=1 Tax=Mycotypha africana TaxID=64632 RepID=UPI0023013334|nr:thiamine diphosphate-binding protein [Mycotypha africana]KAI8991673.1 thiamine diphosphate-binding protein [Mycotypha africana]
MTHPKVQLITGENASFKAAQLLSEHVYTYKKIDHVEEVENSIWGKAVSHSVYKQQDIVSYLRRGAHASALIPSDTLLPAIPQLYKLASQKTGVVLHVSAEKSSPSSSFADFSKVMAVRQSGWTLLSSSTVQEAHDLAIIAHVVAIKTNTPVLHFFDSKRIAQEYATIQVVDQKTLTQLVSAEDLENYRQQQETLLQQQPQSAYLQYKQKKEQEQQEGEEQKDVDVYATVHQVMAQFAEITGRQYKPLEYKGHAEAEHVVVAMGAGATVVEKTVEAIQSTKKNSKIGVLKVRLYRPWSDTDFLQALPSASVTRLAVLEPSHDHASTWNPLFLDITAAYQTAEDNDVEIISGQYGVESQDFSPAQVQAVFAELSKLNFQRKFEVATLKPVIDDIKTISPAGTEEFIIVQDEALALNYAQIAVSTGKNAQIYTVNGVSHIRVSSSFDTFIPSLIATAEAVLLQDNKINAAPALEGGLATDGILILSGTAADANLDSFTKCTKRYIYENSTRVVAIDNAKDLVSSGLSTALSNAVDRAIPESWGPDSFPRTPFFPPPATPAPAPLPIETPYLKMLDQVFQDRLEIANATNSASVWSRDEQNPEAAAPEFGYGKLLNRIQERTRFIDAAEQIVKENKVSSTLYKALSQWLLYVKSDKQDVNAVNKAAKAVIAALGDATIDEEKYIVKNKEYLFAKSNWLIGSDKWAYDLGQSGVHHVIAQGENVNMLIVDTLPYSDGKISREERKKDIGLYAMSFGSAYVASVAVYSSYTGVLHALMEADAYQGPSIVLAYLPQQHKEVENGYHVDPIYTLKETKISVDNGAWPLYRWNPALELENKEPFALDSQRIKKDLEKFLERENHFSQIVSEHPDISELLVSSLEKDVDRRHKKLKRKAREDYVKLLSGLGAANGPPLTVLFASDNGNAEGVAKKIANRGKSRGLQVKLMAMDDYEDVKELGGETNVVFIVSTAGQGEFPSNGRDMWKALNNLITGDADFSQLNYAVFGMGDSHYWPREEDAMFYNRPGKLIDAKLETLGAIRLVELGLGDDQDADGFETGLAAWQPEFWKALGVKDVGAEDDEPKLTDDQMKINSHYLRGTIAEDLADESTGAIGEINGKLLKFHGSYGQDDRDVREERKKMGLEKAYSFMIRVRMPGGVATPAQWLAMDELADKYANGAIKMTTRQAFQLHGVLKKNLRTTIRGINKSLLSTLAACGDVNRNIMVTPVTEIPEVHPQVQEFSIKLMEHLAPKTTAYHEIWLSNELVAGNAVQDFEPIYGPTYLPRKFKIVVAVPPNNDVDIFAHDLGFIAIVDEQKKVTGYNVTIGGGMGMTHGNKKTYPRPANVIGYVPAELGVACAEAVMTTQRDYGDRTNRKHARFKYTIDTHGLDFIKNEIEQRMGAKFEEIKPFEFKDNADRYGWSKGLDDKWHFGMFIENGKIKDWPDFQPKSGLKELAQWHKGEFRLSPNQHLIIANVPEEDLEKTKALLAKYKMDNLSFTGLRLNAMACVALPTCGLAMAESERYLPTLVGHLEHAIEEAGLRDDAITIRMTGCPNGCARPYLAELAFVGKAPNTYNVYLGGGHQGQRLNKLYKESLKEEEILKEINPIIKRYALERLQDEPFGDFVIRAGYVKKTITGTDFHDL